MQCDVLVIGGGSAGVAAAVAAARSGARTVLLERHGTLGGMAAAALVHSICGLYLLRSEPGAVLANPGFPSEFAERLLAAGGAWGPQRMGRVDVLLQHPAAFARQCDELVTGAGVELRLHTEVIAIDGRQAIEAVHTHCRGVRQSFEPGVVVDASGDGETAALMGVACEQTPGDRLQRPAFIFSLHGVDPAALEGDGRLRVAGHLAAAVHHGTLSRAALGATFRATGRGGEAFVTIDLDPPGISYDPTDPACLTALEVHGRAIATELTRHLQESAAGFAHSHLAALPTRVGIRESRRLIGEYRLTAEDLAGGATFDDAVALATWPMELRETATGPRLRYPRDNRPCQIPLRALRARDVGNLFMAGRCIACSHEAQASVRVIGTCLATGEAAGLAAALAAGGSAASAAAVRDARERLASSF